MALPMLYPDEKPNVHRHSSLDQYKGFLSVVTRGGYTPIVFDQLDSINCQTIASHPVVISFGNDIGYHYHDAECSYVSDKYIYYDKEGVEQVPLPEEQGGKGEFYLKYVRENAFINFDTDDALGVRNTKHLRVGTDYVLADETLPPVA